jgi:hypothetical protein
MSILEIGDFLGAHYSLDESPYFYSGVRLNKIATLKIKYIKLIVYVNCIKLIVYVNLFCSVMSSVRSQRLFDRISAEVGLSDAGRAFLIASIDPNHDEPITGLRGLPDGIQSESVCQLVHQKIEISCPADVTSGTWDAHIQSLPITALANAVSANYYDSTTTFSAYSSNINVINATQASAAGAYTPVGNLNITTRGTGIGPVSCFVSPGANIHFNQLNMPDNYTRGIYRVIGAAWEVRSTGPKLYRSGSVYTYRIPSPNTQMSNSSQIVIPATGTDNAVFQNSVKWFDGLPFTSQDASNIPNAQFWDAADGVYMPETMDNIEQATFCGAGTSLMYTFGTNNTPANATNGSAIWQAKNGKLIGVPRPQSIKFNDQTGFNPISLNMDPGVDVTQFNHSGAYFSGLSLQDTLDIRMTWFVERVPGVENPDLLVLSKPTPVRDPQCLQMYSAIMSGMPAGMKADANALGDWFRDALEVATETVAPALAALPGPVGALGKGLTVAGGLSKVFLPKKKVSLEVAPSQIPESRAEVREELKEIRKIPKALSKVVSAPGKKKVAKKVKKEVKKDLKKLMKKKF